MAARTGTTKRLSEKHGQSVDAMYQRMSRLSGRMKRRFGALGVFVDVASKTLAYLEELARSPKILRRASIAVLSLIGLGILFWWFYGSSGQSKRQISKPLIGPGTATNAFNSPFTASNPTGSEVRSNGVSVATTRTGDARQLKEPETRMGAEDRLQDLDHFESRWFILKGQEHPMIDVNFVLVEEGRFDILMAGEGLREQTAAQANVSFDENPADELIRRTLAELGRFRQIARAPQDSVLKWRRRQQCNPGSLSVENIARVEREFAQVTSPSRNETCHEHLHRPRASCCGRSASSVGVAHQIQSPVNGAFPCSAHSRPKRKLGHRDQDDHATLNTDELKRVLGEGNTDAAVGLGRITSQGVWSNATSRRRWCGTDWRGEWKCEGAIRVGRIAAHTKVDTAQGIRRKGTAAKRRRPTSR